MVEVRPVYYFVIVDKGKVIVELNKDKYFTYILSDKKIIPKRLFKKIITVEFVDEKFSLWVKLYHNEANLIKTCYATDPTLWINYLRKVFERNYSKWRKENER